MTTRQELLTAFDELLQPARFKDYGPNGLQVEGRLRLGRPTTAASS
jgi:putative NIF3 family GTP cyclohydrolase 1 type 2